MNSKLIGRIIFTISMTVGLYYDWKITLIILGLIVGHHLFIIND